MKTPTLAFTLALLALAPACGVDDVPVPGDADAADEAEQADDALGQDQKGDTPGWSVEPALHLGERRYGAVDVGERDVLAMWVDGSADAPVVLELRADGIDAGPVRLAVLGRLEDGEREVLGSAGYAAPAVDAAVTVEIDEPGQILVVVGSYQLASFADFELSARCAGGGCAPERVDALASPKLGGLVGELTEDGEALIRAELNAGLAAGDHFEVELWAAPPGRRWLAERVAVSESSGDQVNFLLPADAIAEGDDLLFVVRPGEGLGIADAGVWARFAPLDRIFARLDAVLYSDLGAVTINGVTGFFEGTDAISLRDAASDKELAAAQAVGGELPGSTGIGLGVFEVVLEPEIWLADGSVNPDLPRDGDVLSVGRVIGDGSFQTFGCFEFCNDLAGTGTCTARPRACP